VGEISLPEGVWRTLRWRTFNLLKPEVYENSGIVPLPRTHFHYAAAVSRILPSSNSAGLL
jgi:hypothetical protein